MVDLAFVAALKPHVADLTADRILVGIVRAADISVVVGAHASEDIVEVHVQIKTAVRETHVDRSAVGRRAVTQRNDILFGGCLRGGNLATVSPSENRKSRNGIDPQ